MLSNNDHTAVAGQYQHESIRDSTRAQSYVVAPTAIYARLHLSTLDKALQGMADQMQHTAGLMEHLPVSSEWPG